MIVALDIDGTITRCPEFFSLLSKALKAAGHTVLVITFRGDSVDDIATELEGLGIVFSELVTAPMTLFMRDFVTWKASVCAERNVDILFEDMPDVAAAVGPPTVVMLPLEDRTRRLMASIPWSEDL